MENMYINRHKEELGKPDAILTETQMMEWYKKDPMLLITPMTFEEFVEFLYYEKM